MHLFKSFVSGVLHQTQDGGGGAGAPGGGAPGGGSAPSGGAPGGGGDPWSGNGNRQTPSPISLSDDTPISHDGKTMSWKDYRDSQYAPKSEVENARKATRQQIEGELRTLAQRIKTAQAQNPRQPQADPLAQFRDMPLVAGKDMAAALEGTLGPVAQVIAGMQQKLNQQDAYLRKLGTGFGTLAKERGGKERSTRVEQAISSLGEAYDPKDPFLQDVSQDILDAWEFDKPEEFGQILGQRLKGMEEYVKRKQQADLARAKKRLFTRPGGNASPNGAARPDPRTAVKHAADILFGPQSQNQRT